MQSTQGYRRRAHREKRIFLCLKQELGEERASEITHKMRRIRSSDRKKYKELCHLLGNILLVVMHGQEVGKVRPRARERLLEYYAEISKESERKRDSALCAS